VQPFGVDVCSGVRTAGKLDEDKLRRFFAAVRGTGEQGDGRRDKGKREGEQLKRGRGKGKT
jgi:hypothetical protein